MCICSMPPCWNGDDRPSVIISTTTNGWRLTVAEFRATTGANRNLGVAILECLDGIPVR
jgi:hypothetical protein